MPANSAETPQRMLRTPEAARFLSLSPSTLEKHRIFGTGPKFIKLGGRVVYKLEDLSAWAENGVCRSTHDANVRKIAPATRTPGGKA